MYRLSGRPPQFTHGLTGTETSVFLIPKGIDLACVDENGQLISYLLSLRLRLAQNGRHFVRFAPRRG